jgi:hypothetical protein
MVCIFIYIYLLSPDPVLCSVMVCIVVFTYLLSLVSVLHSVGLVSTELLFGGEGFQYMSIQQNQYMGFNISVTVNIRVCGLPGCDTITIQKAFTIQYFRTSSSMYSAFFFFFSLF